MRIILLLIIAVAGVSCGPPNQNSNSKSPKDTIPQLTPVFYPQTQGPFPAILVLPQAVRDITNEKFIGGKLAEEGYVAQVVPYVDRKFLGIFNDTARLDSFKKLVSENLASLRARPRVDSDRIGVIGHSLGGYFVTYLASRSDDVGFRAGVIYYGVYDVPEQIKNLKVPILAFQGDADFPEFIRHALDMELIARDHKKQFELVFFTRAHHGFQYGPHSDWAGPYDKAAIKNSWIRMITFLDEHVKRPHP